VYGLYYRIPALSFANYASVVLAAGVYAIVFAKFYRDNRTAA